MFNQRKADKIDNVLDNVFDALLEMGVAKSTLHKLIDVHNEITQEFERLANDHNPFED